MNRPILNHYGDTNSKRCIIKPCKKYLLSQSKMQQKPQCINLLQEQNVNIEIKLYLQDGIEANEVVSLSKNSQCT